MHVCDWLIFMGVLVEFMMANLGRYGWLLLQVVVGGGVVGVMWLVMMIERMIKFLSDVEEEAYTIIRYSTKWACLSSVDRCRVFFVDFVYKYTIIFVTTCK